MHKVRSMLLCGAVMAAVCLAPASTASAAGDVFGGTWTSTDTDGSHQTLTVRGAGPVRRAVTLYDDSATGACGGAPARVAGSGVIDGVTLILRGALTCRPGGNPFFGTITVAWVYHSSSDTLVDEFGVTWERST